jgi:hypothetical protein
MTLTPALSEQFALAISELFSQDELAQIASVELRLQAPATFAALELIEQCERHNITPRLIFALCNVKPKLRDFLSSVVTCS